MSEDNITDEHLEVLMAGAGWECAEYIITDLRRWGLWDDRAAVPNQRARQLVGELVFHARNLLKQV